MKTYKTHRERIEKKRSIFLAKLDLSYAAKQSVFYTPSGLCGEKETFLASDVKSEGRQMPVEENTLAMIGQDAVSPEFTGTIVNLSVTPKDNDTEGFDECLHEYLNRARIVYELCTNPCGRLFRAACQLRIISIEEAT